MSDTTRFYLTVRAADQSQALAALREVFNDGPVEAFPEEERVELVFEEVSKWYGDTVAVASLSFTLEPGVTGLLGHNGAGKSTALKLCAGFATPDAGTRRVLFAKQLIFGRQLFRR